MEHYSTIRKNKVMPFAATWMDLEIVLLSEVSQTEKDEYPIILLICGILKKDENELTYIHRCREKIYGYQGIRGGVNW